VNAASSTGASPASEARRIAIFIVILPVRRRMLPRPLYNDEAPALYRAAALT
jgi:hypothetical protein